MTFTTTEQRTEGKGKKQKTVEDKREFVIEPGSHAYCTLADFHAEWDSLTEKQQRAFLKVREDLSAAFSRAQVTLSLELDLDGPFFSKTEECARPYVPHKLTDYQKRCADAGKILPMD
jgi:hypothetical protein